MPTVAKEDCQMSVYHSSTTHAEYTETVLTTEREGPKKFETFISDGTNSESLEGDQINSSPSVSELDQVPTDISLLQLQVPSSLPATPGQPRVVVENRQGWLGIWTPMDISLQPSSQCQVKQRGSRKVVQTGTVRKFGSERAKVQAGTEGLDESGKVQNGPGGMDGSGNLELNAGTGGLNGPGKVEAQTVPGWINGSRKELHSGNESIDCSGRLNSEAELIDDVQNITRFAATNEKLKIDKTLSLSGREDQELLHLKFKSPPGVSITRVLSPHPPKTFDLQKMAVKNRERNYKTTFIDLTVDKEEEDMYKDESDNVIIIDDTNEEVKNEKMEIENKAYKSEVFGMSVQTMNRRRGRVCLQRHVYVEGRVVTPTNKGGFYPVQECLAPRGRFLSPKRSMMKSSRSVKHAKMGKTQPTGRSLLLPNTGKIRGRGTIMPGLVYPRVRQVHHKIEGILSPKLGPVSPWLGHDRSRIGLGSSGIGEVSPSLSQMPLEENNVSFKAIQESLKVGISYLFSESSAPFSSPKSLADSTVKI